ncbi:IS3 family transposase, partial [Achromobacter sp. KAs 3-5]
MRQAFLRPVWKRRFVRNPITDLGQPTFKNLLDRQFDVSQPNRAWVTDVTCINTAQGWLHLAAVL